VSTVSFNGLLIISVIAVAAPVLAASVRRVKLPSAVVEIVAGTTVGPSALGWVKIDQPVNAVALLGLAFLLFLAGLGIDLRATAPRQLRAPLAGFAWSPLLGAIAGAARPGLPKRAVHRIGDSVPGQATANAQRRP
jgi:Kef-type K+ transport system membrane component KefB